VGTWGDGEGGVEVGGGGEVAVSQSLGPPSLEAGAVPAYVVVRGAEVGTDLCDTHAARRITHSLAHNIHPPKPRRTPTLPPFLAPRRHPDERQTHQYCRTRATWRYLLRIGIMLSRWFPSRRGREPRSGYRRERASG
jgi:hypothetical protein